MRLRYEKQDSCWKGLLTITRSTFPRSAKNWRKASFSAAERRELRWNALYINFCWVAAKAYCVKFDVYVDSTEVFCSVLLRASKRVILPLLARVAWKRLQICTDMLLIITSNSNKLFIGVNIDDLEWPWTSKIEVLVNFLAIFGCVRHFKSEL